MTVGPTAASLLQILVFFFITVVLIRERIGDDILGSYRATGVSKTFVAPEFVSNSTNHRTFKPRPKRFTSRRVLHTLKGISSFSLERDLLLCGDVTTNPGPKGEKSMPEYPCSECHRAVRNNQNAILCATCGNWSHVKCLNMSRLIFQYYLDQPDIEWTCPACALPPLTDSFFEEVSEGDTPILAEECQGETIQNIVLEQSPHRDVTEGISDNDQLEFFRKHHKDLLIAQLNINSIQNKFEELTEVIKKINAHIMFVSENTIDASYLNVQLKAPNYSLYRNDRKKGGGGIMALISHSLVKSQLKPDKNLKTLEIIALEIKTDTDNMVIVGIYRPPRALCGEYQTLLESEVSHVCNWANLNSNLVVVAGDLNLNRLRPEKPEGKLRLDLEVEQGFECLITKPTRIEKPETIITESLIDVLLTNRPDWFQLSGNYYPCFSDHDLVYGVLNQKMNHNKPKVITFSSYKSFDPEHYKQLLSSAPWHIGQLFDDVDDQENEKKRHCTSSMATSALSCSHHMAKTAEKPRDFSLI